MNGLKRLKGFLQDWIGASRTTSRISQGRDGDLMVCVLRFEVVWMLREHVLF